MSGLYNYGISMPHLNELKELALTKGLNIQLQKGITINRKPVYQFIDNDGNTLCRCMTKDNLKALLSRMC